MADDAIHIPQCRTAGGPDMDAWAAKHSCPECSQLLHQCACEDDGDAARCGRCGGDGVIEYLDGDGGDWGEDCPSEINHLIPCRECNGTGRA